MEEDLRRFELGIYSHGLGMAYPNRKGLKFETSNLQLTPELAGKANASQILKDENARLQTEIAALKILLVDNLEQAEYPKLDLTSINQIENRLNEIENFDWK